MENKKKENIIKFIKATKEMVTELKQIEASREDNISLGNLYGLNFEIQFLQIFIDGRSLSKEEAVKIYENIEESNLSLNINEAESWVNLMKRCVSALDIARRNPIPLSDDERNSVNQKLAVLEEALKIIQPKSKGGFRDLH